METTATYSVLVLHEGRDAMRRWHGPYRTREEAQARGDQPDVVRVLAIVEQEG